MKWNWNTLQLKIRAVFSPQSTAGLDAQTLKEMARGIMTTRPDEIGCAECFDRMDSFVEMELAGKDAAEAMPLEEVANRMGTNRNALYKLLHDARQRLKKKLEEEGLSPQDVLAAFSLTG